MPHKAKRRSLIVYSTLAVIFVVQLAWWVIHQIDLIDQRHEQYLMYADSRRGELVDQLQPYFSEIRTTLSSSTNPSSPFDTSKIRELCAENPLIQGVTVTAIGSDVISQCGVMTDGLHLSAERGYVLISMAIVFDYAQEIAQLGAPSLQFVPPSVDTLLKYPLSEANVTYDSAEYRAYTAERESSLRMLIWEGGFFFVLTSLGLALIYHSLMRTRDAVRMQENFTMAVTHELRTPLSSLQLALDALKRENLPADKRQRLHTMIAIDLKRLGTLITNLLNVGRVIQRSDNEITDFNLNQALKKYIDDRADEFEIKHADVRLETTSSEVYVHCNQADFERILDSVIDNAIKFSEKAPEILVQTIEHGRSAEIRISDAGIGIPKDELGKVFDRFYRVGDELTRKRSGTGLGLYLARELAVANGGEMSISSEGRGKGTTVILKLRTVIS